MDPNDRYNYNASGTGWNQYPGYSLNHERINQSFSGSTPSVNMTQSTTGQGINQSFTGQSHGQEDQSASGGHRNVSNLMNQSLPINSMAPIAPISNSSRSQWTSQTSGLNNNPPSTSSFMPINPMASMMMNPMMAMAPGPWTSTTGLNNAGGFGNSGLNPGFGNSGLNPGFGSGMNGGHNQSVASFAANAALQNWLIQYNQWWHYVENRRKEAIRMATPASERPRLTPHRYPHRHCRSSFGAKNQLMVTFGTNVYIQAIDPSLIDFGEPVQVGTWPGPLTYDGRRARKDDVLEYIRLREGCIREESMEMSKDIDRETIVSQNDDGIPHTSTFTSIYDSPSRMNHEKKLIWLLLSMLVKQNGIISGPDICELLLTHNEPDFITDDQGTHLSQYRRFLMLGQRKTALEFATKHSLWGHAFTLTFFTNFIKHLTLTAHSTAQSHPVSTITPTLKPDDPMVLMVSKFINTTLDRDDPLSILYRSLLSQIYQTSTLESDRNPHLLPSGVNNSNNNSNKVIKTDNLKQFSILLANDCELGNQVAPRANELLKLIITIRNHLTQSLINISRLDTIASNLSSPGHETGQGSFPNHNNSTNYNSANYNSANYNSANYNSQEQVIRYTDELVFVNEILEYAREEKEFIEALVPYKVKLLTRLFDFGLVTSATAYGYQLRQYYEHYHEYFPGKNITDSLLDWNTILSIVWDIECKLYGFDVTNGLILKPVVQIKSSANHPPSARTGEDKNSANHPPSARAGENESVPVSEDETNGSEDLEEDETDDTSGAHVIGHRLAAMRLPTVPEDPRPRGHSDARHRMDSERRYQETRYGQEPDYRQDMRRESSEVSDSRSASPQKAPIARTSSVSSSGPNFQGNRFRTLSREDSSEKRTSSPTTPSPGHHPTIPTFPAIPHASIPPLPSSSGSNFFVPPPPTDDESPATDNFLSNPEQYQSQEQGHQPGHNQSGHGDNPSDDSDHLNRRESYGSGGSFSQPPILESTVAPGYLGGGLMSQNRDTIGSPGMSAFSPINSPTMGTNELVKPRSSSNGPIGQSDQSNVGGKDSEIEKRKGNKSGWFGSVISRVIPQGPVRAKLPDDSDKSIYYDNELKRWVDKNNPDDGALMDAIAKGPPKMSMAMGPGQLPLAGRGQNPLASGLPSAQQPLSRSAMAQSMPSLSVGKPTTQLPTSQLPTLPASGLNGSTNEFSFVKKNNLRPKYVDAWQQQQRKND